MSAAAAAQLRRILALIPECADDRPHAIADVARRAGTDPLTLFKDVRALSDRFDDPGGFVEAVQIFLEPERLRVRSDHFLRPMRLTAAELAALDLGIALLTAETPLEERPVLAGARERLEAAIAKLPGQETTEGLHHADVPADDPAALAELRRGYRESRKLRLRYRKAASEATVRVVSPLAILFASGQWYLVAADDSVEGLRIFRVDRVESLEVLEERFRAPETLAIDELFSDGRAFASPDTVERVRIRFGPRVARWIAERDEQPVAEDGSYEQELPLADLDWVTRYVLQYGAEAEVISPPQARMAVIEALDAMGR
ncbi:MAG: helix-turn-helix transcriptional regulator [Gemmatimonadales bacterium]